MGTRKKRAREETPLACLPRTHPFSLSPTTSKRLLRRLRSLPSSSEYVFPWNSTELAKFSHLHEEITKELQMRHNFEKSILSAPFPRTTFLTWCKWTLTVFSWCPRKTTKLPNLHEQVFQGKTCFCIPRDLGSATGSVISFNELPSGNVQWQYTEKTWLKESCAKTIN